MLYYAELSSNIEQAACQQLALGSATMGVSRRHGNATASSGMPGTAPSCQLRVIGYLPSRLPDGNSIRRDLKKKCEIF